MTIRPKGSLKEIAVFYVLGDPLKREQGAIEDAWEIWHILRKRKRAEGLPTEEEDGHIKRLQVALAKVYREQDEAAKNEEARPR